MYDTQRTVDAVVDAVLACQLSRRMAPPAMAVDVVDTGLACEFSRRMAPSAMAPSAARHPSRQLAG